MLITPKRHVGIMITKTDGKKKLTIETAEYEEAIELGVCRNGYQTTVVTIDFEMIDWLKDALEEYSNVMGELPKSGE